MLLFYEEFLPHPPSQLRLCISRPWVQVETDGAETFRER